MTQTIAEGTEYVVIINDLIHWSGIADQDECVDNLVDGYTMFALFEGIKNPIVKVEVVS